jgi:NAD(P)-dependent dehydrogenase (short-subunit alcohol dehydrogenase family)
MQLQGKGIVITGASQGLGKEIAAACVGNGANVFICGRDRARLEIVRNELSKRCTADQVIGSEVANLSNAEEAERLIASAIRELPAVHGLVNNAGISGPKGLAEENDWQEWVRTIETNLFGPVYLCKQILPLFRRQGYGKIVNLSGGGATAPMPRFTAYAASKAAIVRFTETVAEETKGSGIDVNAVAPGALATALLDEVIAAGPQKIGQEYYNRMLKVRAEGGSPLQKAAELCVFLLSPASDGISGRLLSAVWDPWTTLAQHRDQLAKSDIYTLRRIVPADRGLDWDNE